jgi:hypothetical protein
MSGPLRNTRHEAFAKALFERPKTGMTLAQCYESAGYPTKGHASETMASRLSFAEHIQARVSEELSPNFGDGRDQAAAI